MEKKSILEFSGFTPEMEEALKKKIVNEIEKQDRAEDMALMRRIRKQIAKDKAKAENKE